MRKFSRRNDKPEINISQGKTSMHFDYQKTLLLKIIKI